MKKSPPPLFPAFETSFRIFATCFGICVFIVSSGLAQTWDGGSVADSNWTTAANWSADTLPLNNGTADVVFAGSTRLSPLVDTAQSVRTVTFATGASAFNLGGSQTLNITGNSGTWLTVNSTSAQTVSANLTLSGASALWLHFSAGAHGDLLFSGNINGGASSGGAGGTGRIIADGTVSGNVTLSGTVSNAGIIWGYSAQTTKLTLSGANTYLGATDIRSGTLQLGDGGATGSLSTSSSIVTSSGSGPRSLAINRNNAVVQGTDFNGAAITGLATFIQAGSGTTTLNAANTYSGGTTVSAGTLLVNNTTGSGVGSGAVTVASGATLGGSGSISGSVTVASGGILSPGNSPGNLTFNNGLTLAGAYKWELAALSTVNPGVDFDTITITAGNADITGATLTLTLGGFAPTNVAFWQSDQTWAGILNNTGAGTLTGAFGTIDNSGWSALGAFSTANVGNDVNLVWTAVPEPSTWVLFGGSLAVLMVVCRRRQTT